MPRCTKRFGTFSPSYHSWLERIPDPRRVGSITYPLLALLWMGFLLFILKLEARRQLTYKVGRYPSFLDHLNVLAQVELTTSPHDDTVADLFEQLPYEELDELRFQMVSTLIRKKVFSNSRLLDEYHTIAIDGTGMHYFNERHCEHCLTKESSKTGKILYYHNVLEAKLVTRDGFAISMATEFIENPDDFDRSLSLEKRKQDCELKAFKRLAPKLHSRFPQLKICLLLDSLYAAESVFAICKKYHWQAIINFKEGSIPSVQQEHCQLKKVQRANKLNAQPAKHVKQTIVWTNSIDYQGYTLSEIECEEIQNQGSSNETQKTFVYLATFNTTPDRARALVNEGGRQRWNIEDGFNTQKKRGYELEHVYCQNENAGKCLYLCLQIAHCINQLFENGSLIAQHRKKLGSIKNLTADLLMHMLMVPLDKSQVDKLFEKPFQIRFNTS